MRTMRTGSRNNGVSAHAQKVASKDRQKAIRPTKPYRRWQVVNGIFFFLKSSCARRIRSSVITISVDVLYYIIFYIISK